MRTLLIIAFTAFYGLTYAQPKVVAFESDDKSVETKPLKELNVLKIGVFELLSGDFPIYYERVINDHFSAEVSLGATFGDYYGSIFIDSDYSPLDENVDAEYGISFSAALRFYPIQTLKQFYISPEFKFRQYNWNRDILLNPGNEWDPGYQPVYHTASETRKYVMPRITLGYTFLYEYNLIFDWHVGIGMNTPTQEMYDTNYNQVREDKLNTRPRVHFGLKIGYIF